MKLLKKNVLIYLSGVFILTSFSAASQKQAKTEYPKSYDEAINIVIKISDEKTKNLIKSCPRFDTPQFADIIHSNHLINYQDRDLLTSCAKHIGAPYVHFEDVANVILLGVWDKLNSDLDLMDFEKVNPEDYFVSIQRIIIKGKDQERLGYLASLPYWVYHDDYPQSRDSLQNAKLLSIAKKMVYDKGKDSYLALLYISQFETNLEEKTRLIEEYFNDKTNTFEIPSYQYFYTNKGQDLTGIDYKLDKISSEQLALRCFGIIYKKDFNSPEDLDAFISYCHNNYLAKWKFLKTLSSEDYRILIKEPRKLLEIYGH